MNSISFVFLACAMATLSSSISTSAIADDIAPGTRIIFQDSRYVYYRTPLWRMNSKKERAIRDRAFAKLGSYLKNNHDRLMKASAPDVDPATELEQLSQFEKETDEYLAKLQTLLVKQPEYNVENPSLRPSAYVFLLGAKFPRLTLIQDASVQVAVVVLPVQYTMIEKATRKMYVRHKLEFGFSLVNFYNVKSDGNATDTGFRIGGGLIWGPIDHADDFIGPLGNVSISAAFPDLTKRFKLPLLSKLSGARFNFKLGALKQWDENKIFNKKVNPFAFITYAPSAEPAFGTKINVGHAISIDAAFRSIFGNDGMYLDPGITPYTAGDRPIDAPGEWVDPPYPR